MLITHVATSPLAYTLSCSSPDSADVILVNLRRNIDVEKLVEIPFKLKHRVTKKMAVLPLLPGFRIIMEGPTLIDIQPDAKSILRFCGKPSHSIKANTDSHDCFSEIRSAGYNDISLAYKWIFKNYKKVGYFADDGSGFLTMMMDNDFELSEIMQNPFLVTRSKNCSKLNMILLTGKAVALNLTIEMVTAELTRYHLKDVMSGSGHTCFPIGFLFNVFRKEGKAHAVLDVVDREYFRNILMSSNLFEIVDDHVYIQSVHEMEQKIANRIQEFIEARQLPALASASTDLQKFEVANQVCLNQDQQRAILQVFDSNEGNMSLITGSGGTGKSSCVRCIESICAANSWKIELAAPTGMAANRLGKDAKTLHRLLKVVDSDDDTIPKCFETLTCQVLVVDETSMLDLTMFWLMLKSVDCNVTKLVLLGDPNQLPSVRFGQVLSDLIRSNVVPVVKLTTVYRQQRGSTILKIAKRVLDKRMCPASYFASKDVHLIDASDETAIQNEILKLHSQDPDTVIIIPTKKGDVGTRCINNVIKNGKFGDVSPGLHAGLKVMCIRNTHAQDNVGDDVSIYNGQVGVVSQYCSRKDEAIVIFDSGQIVNLPGKNLDMAYALTVHKVQGSEYAHTCLVLHKSHNVMLYDQIFYTAVTRAKVKLTIISDLSCIRKCIETSGSRRISLLSHIISDNANAKKMGHSVFVE